MTLRLLLFSTLFGLIVATGNFQTIAAPTPSKGCSPALARFVRHKVAPGETLEEVAAKYDLIPATLIGTNPALQNGRVFVGSEIAIPPYNGIRVQVPRNQTWKQLAAKYKVRADVLFEVNGCQSVPQQVVFVPGVNWSPKPVVSTSNQIIQSYPLSQQATIALSYGWQVDTATGEVIFHSGIDLLAPAGTPVKAVNNGTVAFAGNGASYGNLVVVNHLGGKQTRYAHLQNIAVSAGNQVKQGDVLGKVGTTGKPSSLQVHLHFELRYASTLGWTAEDPHAVINYQSSTSSK